MRLLIITFLIVFSISYSYSQVEIFPNEFVDTFLSTAERDSTPVIQDERITKLVDKHIEYNKQKKGIIGYRIQIYSGVGGPTIKKEASAIRTKFLKLYPDIPVEIIYNEPYFKVRVGLFRNKSEGFKLFKELEEIFPGSYFIIENEMDYPPL